MAEQDLSTLAYSFTLQPSFEDLPPLPDPDDEIFDDNMANSLFQRMKKHPTSEDLDFLESYRVTFFTLKALGEKIQGNPPILEILGKPIDQLLPASKKDRLHQLDYYKTHWQKYTDDLAKARKLSDGNNWPVTLRYGFIPPVCDEILTAFRTQSSSRLPAPPAEPQPQRSTKYCPGTLKLST